MGLACTVLHLQLGNSGGMLSEVCSTNGIARSSSYIGRGCSAKPKCPASANSSRSQWLHLRDDNLGLQPPSNLHKLNELDSLTRHMFQRKSGPRRHELRPANRSHHDRICDRSSLRRYRLYTLRDSDNNLAHCGIHPVRSHDRTTMAELGPTFHVTCDTILHPKFCGERFIFE